MDIKQQSGLIRENVHSGASVLGNSITVEPKIIDGGSGNNDFYNTTHSSDRVVERENGSINTVIAATSSTLPQNILTDRGNGNNISNDSDNILIGNDDRNRLFGKGGDDTLYSNGGNDFLDGGSGKDTMFGGRGNDIFIVDNVDDKVIEFKNQGVDTVLSSIDYTLPQYVENLTLTGNQALKGEGNDDDNRLIGNGNNNQLMGWKGNDIIYGLGGHDTIYGGDGADRLFGGVGNDTLIGGKDIHPLKNIYGDPYWGDINDGDDYLDGGVGNDILMGGNGDDTYFFAKGYGHDTIIDYRIPGIETLSDPEGNNTVRFGLGIRPEDLDISVDVLSGGLISDIWKVNIKGTDDILFIRNQNADINPAIMNFEFDSRTLQAWTLAESVGIRGNIRDIAIDKDQAYRMNIDDFSIGSDNSAPEFTYKIEKITGGRLAYVTVDEQVNEWVESDTFSYFDGGNLIFVPDNNVADAAIQFRFVASDSVSKNDDAYHTIHFTLKDLPDSGEKILFGDASDNSIIGGDSNDKLYGLDGNDILDGKAGNDVLYGGAGDDTYLFGQGYGTDTIIDTEGSNSVRFAKGISWADLTLSDNYQAGTRTGGSAWQIGFKDTQDSLIIENQSDSKNTSITSFIFYNEILTHNMLLEKINSGITENTLNYADNAEPIQTAVQAPVEGSYSYTDDSSSMAMPRAEDYSAAPLI